MRLVAIALLCAALSGQVIKRGPLAAAGGGGSKSFVQASSGDAAGPAATVSTNAATTTAGDLLYVAWSAQVSGPGCTSGSNPVPSDTGSDAFLPLPIPGGGEVLAAKFTAAGSGYSSPACAVTGGGGTGAACSATQSGGAINAVTVTAIGSGYTSIPTVTITDGGSGTGATAAVVSMGLSGSVGCASHWYVKSAAGTTNNQVTITTGTGFGYVRVVAMEASGTSASTPLDAAMSATSGGSSVTTLTSGAFTTSTADEIIFSAATIEALGNTWAAGSASACASGGGTCTIPSGATPSTTAITGQYKIVSATQTGATVTLDPSGSQQMQLLGATFK